jgi:hypothetical protein
MGSVGFRSTIISNDLGKTHIANANNTALQDNVIKISSTTSNQDISQDIARAMKQGATSLLMAVGEGNNTVLHRIDLTNPDNKVVFSKMMQAIDNPGFQLNTSINFEPKIDLAFGFKNQVLMNKDTGLTGHEAYKKLENPAMVAKYSDKEITGNNAYEWGGGGMSFSGNPTQAEETIMNVVGYSNGKMQMGTALTSEEALAVAVNFVNQPGNRTTANMSAVEKLFPNVDLVTDGTQITGYQTKDHVNGQGDSTVQTFQMPVFATGTDTNARNYEAMHHFDNQQVYNKVGDLKPDGTGATANDVINSLKDSTLQSSAKKAYDDIAQSDFPNLTGAALANAMESPAIVKRIMNAVENTENAMNAVIRTAVLANPGPNSTTAAMNELKAKIATIPLSNQVSNTLDLSAKGEAAIEQYFKQQKFGNGIDINSTTQQIRSDNKLVDIPVEPVKAAPLPPKGAEPLLNTVKHNPNPTPEANTVPDGNKNKPEDVEVKGKAKHKILPTL